MRKILKGVILLTLCLVAIAGPACVFKPSLVGTWQNVEETEQHIEFTNDGSIVVDNGTLRITGTYELIGDDYIKIHLDGLVGGLLNLAAADTWKYQISRNQMTLDIGNQKLTFERAK